MSSCTVLCALLSAIVVVVVRKCFAAGGRAKVDPARLRMVREMLDYRPRIWTEQVPTDFDLSSLPPHLRYLIQNNNGISRPAPFEEDIDAPVSECHISCCCSNFWD